MNPVSNAIRPADSSQSAAAPLAATRRSGRCNNLAHRLGVCLIVCAQVFFTRHAMAHGGGFFGGGGDSERRAARI